MKKVKQTIYALGFFLTFPVLTHADVITFNFTGGLVVANPLEEIILNNGSPVTPISATLIYDTVSGLGNSNLSLTLSGGFWSFPATFHDISLAHQSNTNLITGNALVDWNGADNMPLHIEWDATGMFNAIAFGLQAGDIISGTNLYRDANGNGVGDAGEWLANVNSATPYSDLLQSAQFFSSLQGPAPMAATSGSQGLGESSAFAGVRGYFDIGSGNSMHVVSVATVPVPAAVWLFFSGLAGLFGVARKRR
jgi:hypothetical protein